MQRTLVFAGALCLLTCAGQGRAATWNINALGTGDAPSIQAGIDLASAGDTVLLANGSYDRFPDGNRDIDFRGKAVVVRSASGDPTLCIINCAGSAASPHFGFVFQSGEDTTSVLDGVTIAGGYNANGGAVSCLAGSSPLLSNCRFINNDAADYGGALYCDASSPVVADCEFIGNSAVGQLFNVGGALFCGVGSSAEVRGSRFSYNTGNAGGAFATTESHTVFAGCVFEQNTAEFQGGAADIGFSATAMFRDCLFIQNSSANGGAISGVTAELVNCTLSRNWANADGVGGISCDTVELTRTIISFCLSGTALSEFCDSATVACSNIYGNAGGDWTGCLQGKLSTDGNISSDPVFCDLPNGDYTVAADSECLPANNSCGVLIGAREEGCGAITGILDSHAVLASPLALSAFPNPFNPSTTIRYGIADAGTAFITVYDVRGRPVRRYVRSHESGGTFQLTWDGTDSGGQQVASGAYFVRLVSADDMATHKVVLLK